ncbi:hypothetical protein G7Y89_g5644 [Cudoniella acicularis]|uniref:Uncharacterized protein n=1 Tax=Cudoniella acicularis TaxID=354080 RepID=A0A8H4RM45_9HELO|nr:hypothetical protein G7Y89_g5644 [Cudoniella acicularis]
MLSNSSTIEVPTIGISNSSLQQNFAYRVRLTANPSQATSRLTRVISAVAMSRQRESLQPPISQSNISYSLRAYAPLLRCSSANGTVQSQLISIMMTVGNFTNSNNPYTFGYRLTPQSLNNQTFHWDTTPNLPGKSPDDPDYAHDDIGYFGVLPIWENLRGGPNNTYEMTLQPWWNSSQVMTDLNIAFYGFLSLAGDIWIAIPTARSDTGNQTQMEFINCQLYNSSLVVNVEFSNQVSNITVIEIKWMNDLGYSDI